MSTQDEKFSEVMVDIENQNDIKKNLEKTFQVQLNVILKLRDTEVEKNIFRLRLGLVSLVTMTPFIFCDLYFGFTDLSCSREEPNELAISLSLYLIVSGFMRLSAMIFTLIMITCFDPKVILKKSDCRDLIAISDAMFKIIWSILGAVVFWGYVYGNCNKSFSTYVFVSLLIRFIGVLFAYKLRKENYNNN